LLCELLANAFLRATQRRNIERCTQDDRNFLAACLNSSASAATGNIDQKIVLGGTALHTAVWNKKLEAVGLLLDFGADAHAKDSLGYTPLHSAARAGCVHSAAKLLQHGASPRALDHSRQTPFMVAARSGATETMAFLIGHENDKRLTDLNGQTAHHHAAQQPRLEPFIYLLDAGWDPYQLDAFDRSPLYYALQNLRLASYIYAKCLDLTHLLSNKNLPQPPIKLSAGGQRMFYRHFPQTARLRYLNNISSDGPPPLTLSAWNADIEGLRIRIRAGADLEFRGREGDTALITACRSGRLPSVTHLVRQGSKLAYIHKGRLINAMEAADGQPEVVKWFLVDQWTDQNKLTDYAFNSDKHERTGYWSGVRTVGIPLRGIFTRPTGSSLLQHAKILHGIARNSGWRILVPLNWDAVANFIALPGEL